MSFISDYQSRKTLLAENLNTKGVEASGSEGLTTLINKVSEIDDLNSDGIIILTDKKSMNVGDKVNILALYLKNDELQLVDSMDMRIGYNEFMDYCNSNNLLAYSFSNYPSQTTITHDNNKYSFTVSTHGGSGLLNMDLPITEFTDLIFEVDLSILTIQSPCSFIIGIFSSDYEYTYELRMRYYNPNNYFGFTEGVEEVTGATWTANSNYKLVLSLNGETLTGKVYDGSNNTIYENHCEISPEIKSELSLLNFHISNACTTNYSVITGSINGIKVEGLNNTKLYEKKTMDLTGDGLFTGSHVHMNQEDVVINVEYNEDNQSISSSKTLSNN